MLKNRFYLLLASLGMFGNYVVDDDGAGSSGDVGDIDIDDDGADDDGADDGGKEKKPSTSESSEPDDIKTLKQQIDDLKKDKEQRDKQEAHNQVVSNLQTKYPEFDADKIKNHLVEMYKTDPEKAEGLNNELGFELLYLQEFAPKNVDNDEVEFGRNNGGTSRVDEVREKVKSGGSLSFEDKRTLLGKYL